MLRNYFTLYHAAMELHERLAGGQLVEIHSQQKNELILTFTGLDGCPMQVVVVTHNPLLSLFLRDGVQKKARDAASLMSELWMQRVISIEIAPYDRQITILFANGISLVMQLFSSRTNVFLVSKQKIIDAFKHKNALAGEPYKDESDSPAILRRLESLAMNRPLFMERFNAVTAENIREKVAASLPGFDRHLAEELLRRTADMTNPEALFVAFQSLFYELLDPRALVIEKESGEPEFTLLQSASQHGRSFDSLLEALHHYSIKMWQFLETKTELKTLRSTLLKQRCRIEKTLAGYNPASIAEFARNYECCGHLLMTALYEPRTERESITVPNIFEPEAPLKTIRLKSALTLQKNAEEYFSKASKTRGKLKVMQERQLQLEKERAALDELLAATERITTPKEARRFIADQSESVGRAGALPQKKSPTTLPFRTIRLSESVTLLVGKNAANNELLTFSHTRPNDIWLHARGASGSHCVLKGATVEHNRKEIQRAAEIAAWYSSAKHSELVPVMYTLKRYVRRGKNLALGQVIVEREEVVMVRPSKEAEKGEKTCDPRIENSNT